MNKVELERMKFVAQTYFTENLLESFGMKPEIEIDFDIYWRRILLSVKQKIFGNQIKYFREEIPQDWKEAFKDRWLPRWARSYWPIKYRIIEFDVREVVPSLNVPNYPTYIITELNDWNVTDPPKEGFYD